MFRRNFFWFMATIITCSFLFIFTLAFLLNISVQRQIKDHKDKCELNQGVYQKFYYGDVCVKNGAIIFINK